MALDLFAGIPVSDYAAALSWYERLLGSPPTFIAHDTEAVWELAEHRSLVIEQRPEHAGHAMHTIFVDDFDELVARIADRGLEPTKRETYANGVRKATYRDPDGNEIGFGGDPADQGN
jgi:predicted enzyme related to lactoylglutathione lyase